ncbi:hypothetical protein JZ751_009186 [Albula glossodonta]|uniref:FYVE-type domain-containing protein n=1 Tax=Albula glossodonta TaxID=121402 RepID=A0A8T2N1X7_9TELE|nr:hypothetical protein JZ751_009186 [Albula glossodonta]
MENYFQAEAFNLDKVLDEFEQNEDESDTPTLTDAKWTQILAPPAHLLTLNPALTNAELSPYELPLGLKPASALEDRPLGLRSPLSPQPNIGKLVTSGSLENGHPSCPDLNGRADEPPSASWEETGGPTEGAESNSEEEQRGRALSAEPTEHGGVFGSPEEESDLSGPDQPSHGPRPGGEHGAEPGLCGDGVVVGSGEGLDSDTKDHQECVSNGGMAGQREELRPEEQLESSPGANHGLEETPPGESPCHSGSLSNGLEVGEAGSPGDERLSHAAPSKEDSVTEEKEVEESKQECGEQNQNQRLNNSGGGGSSLQPVSVPFGGARPKQPVSLKLQIPRPLSGQVQNQLGSSSKNKNLDAQNRASGREAGQEEQGPAGGGFDPGGGSGAHTPSGLQPPSESPDNDLQAGHQGALSRKPHSSLGEVAPVWVPDCQAPICMKCEVKFTFTKRRHHCRACGKVFCAACCSLRCRLMYMDRKEARVCVTCHSTLTSAQSWESVGGGCGQSPNPNNPAEYCSTIPPLQQAQASGALSSPPPTVMVPVGVLKQPGNEGSLPRDQRRVWFADGILPNGEVADSSSAPAGSASPSETPPAAQESSRPPAASAAEGVSAPPQGVSAPAGAPTGSGAPAGSPVGSSVNLIPKDGLPPILISTGIKGGTGGQLTDYAVEERPSEILLMQQLEEGGADPLVFVLNANLLAMVKLVNYVNRKCWCVVTKGMHAVGQAEVVVLLQCLPDEKSLPKDVFSHFVQLYQDAITGNVVSHLGHSFFTQSFLGSKEHGGFLYISPSFQSLQDLLLPNPPYLFGILIQKWETPWAKVFPLRLMLRLGAEYRFYPCPLFSVRFRKPLFGETGHTIMNLLADFRNYQYTLPAVTGLVVDMEVRKTCIKIPSNRYNEMMKAMNKSNEHVLAVGACFNERADSHLVCVQNDDGNYQTQAISIHNQPRKVTGACFFVFSGALKASSGYLAKSSIVEDGVMVQITAETMDALRQALREMKDFSITCGKAGQEEGLEHVTIQWLEDEHSFNRGVISPIDGRSMESISSIKIFHRAEFKASGKSDDQPNGSSDPADHSRLTENVARAFCVALCPHLKLLKEDGMSKLGLRVTLDSDQVGYLAGSNGQPLLPQYMKDLDSALVPVIHGGACQLTDGPVRAGFRSSQSYGPRAHLTSTLQIIKPRTGHPFAKDRMTDESLPEA